MTRPLTITKMVSCEDEGLQHTLDRLAAIDVAFAKDQTLQGAIPGSIEDWARLAQFVSDAAPCEDLDALEDAVAYRRLQERIQAAYLGGLAVGLRLARATHNPGGAR